MEIEEMLRAYRNVAVIGLSRDPQKDSNAVASYLQRKGYRIVPINPFADSLLGERCYKSLLDVPEYIQREIEIVDIFRPSGDVPAIVDQAIELRRKFGNPQVVWMQHGIRHPEAAARARGGGLEVLEDRCMMEEHRKMELLSGR
jgi:predicted CoA-binding protein